MEKRALLVPIFATLLSPSTARADTNEAFGFTNFTVEKVGNVTSNEVSSNSSLDLSLGNRTPEEPDNFRNEHTPVRSINSFELGVPLGRHQIGSLDVRGYGAMRFSKQETEVISVRVGAVIYSRNFPKNMVVTANAIAPIRSEDKEGGENSKIGVGVQYNF